MNAASEQNLSGAMLLEVEEFMEEWVEGGTCSVGVHYDI